MVHRYGALGGIKISMEEFIKAWVLSRFGKQINLDTNFFDLGLFDSLSFAQLIVDLESFLGTEIDFSQIIDWNDINSIAGIVKFLNSQN